jgi:hypothetical protein
MPSQKKIIIKHKNGKTCNYMKYWLDQDIIGFVCIDRFNNHELQFIILPKKYDRVVNGKTIDLNDEDIKFIGYLHIDDYNGKNYIKKPCKDNLFTDIYFIEDYVYDNQYV